VLLAVVQGIQGGRTVVVEGTIDKMTQGGDRQMQGHPDMELVVILVDFKEYRGRIRWRNVRYSLLLNPSSLGRG
jgi:hypothetical protein